MMDFNMVKDRLNTEILKGIVSDVAKGVEEEGNMDLAHTKLYTYLDTILSDDKMPINDFKMMFGTKDRVEGFMDIINSSSEVGFVQKMESYHFLHDTNFGSMIIVDDIIQIDGSEVYRKGIVVSANHRTGEIYYIDAYTRNICNFYVSDTCFTLLGYDSDFVKCFQDLLEVVDAVCFLSD